MYNIYPVVSRLYLYHLIDLFYFSILLTPIYNYTLSFLIENSVISPQMENLFIGDMTKV